jgi:putative heme-binding domain-containing protein
MRRASSVGVVLFSLAVLLGARPAFAQRFHVQSEAEQGEQLYQANCITCHGLEGDEVSGIDFGKGRYKRATSDDDLMRIIRDGIPGTAMPPNKLSEIQRGNIVAYLRSLTAMEPLTSLPGDAARGQALVEGKGNCLSCHRIQANGSRTGPDLTDVGQFRRRVEIEKAILDPSAEIRPENRSYKVVTRDGTTIVGRLMNHDTLMVLLIDDKQQLRAFNKADLRSYGFVMESPMPSYKGKISNDELADMVRYLASLKGIKPQPAQTP